MRRQVSGIIFKREKHQPEKSINLQIHWVNWRKKTWWECESTRFNLLKGVDMISLWHYSPHSKELRYETNAKRNPQSHEISPVARGLIFCGKGAHIISKTESTLSSFWNKLNKKQTDKCIKSRNKLNGFIWLFFQVLRWYEAFCPIFSRV